MRASEIRKQSREELLQHLGELRQRKIDLAIQLRQRKVKNVRELRAVKKDYARMLTILGKTAQRA